jgi:hypothetical protein
VYVCGSGRLAGKLCTSCIVIRTVPRNYQELNPSGSLVNPEVPPSLLVLVERIREDPNVNEVEDGFILRRLGTISRILSDRAYRK